MNALDAKPAEAGSKPWRAWLWCVFATLAVGPIIWGIIALIFDIIRANAGFESSGWGGLALTSVLTSYVTYRFLRWRLHRLAPFSIGALFGWMIFAGVTMMLAQGAYDAVQKIQASQQDKKIGANLRRLEEAERNIFEADHEHLFFTYDEIVGPNRPVASLQSVRGEDYRLLYPRHFGQTYAIIEKDFPPFLWFVSLERLNPPGNWENPRCLELPGGGRLEYYEANNRLPDGPVRFFRRDGKLWAEARCEAGHLVDRTVYSSEGVDSSPVEPKRPARAQAPMLQEWTVIGSSHADWQRTEMTVTGSTSTGDSLLLSKQDYGEVTFSATARSPNREASLAVRMQDAANGYLVVFVPDGLDWNRGVGGLWFIRRKGGAESSLGHYHGPLFPAVNQNAKLSVVAAGDSFTIKLNGTEVLRAKDATYASGRVGFRIYGDSQLSCFAVFTDVQIK